MTRGPWKYQKSFNHHHVLMGKEVLDVNSEEDARAIAEVPRMIKLLNKIKRNSENTWSHLNIADYEDEVYKILKRIKR